MAEKLNIPQLYIYIDTVIFPIWAIMGVAFAGHFVGNILTGRAKKRFIKWQWPAHDHIPPVAPRLAHLTHVLCMIGLAFTGLYIHLPFFVGGRTAMRNIHYMLMVIVTVNLIYRLYYAFFSKNRDFREFGLRWIDIKAMPATIKYYVFMASDKPHLSKYNPMQRMTYTLFPILLIFQALTGFSIAFPVLFFGWASMFFGISAAAAYARLVHYVINWLFIILTTAHIYLSLTEDLPAFILFFFQIPPKHAPALGHTEHEPEVVHLPGPVGDPAIAPEPVAVTPHQTEEQAAEPEPIVAYVPPSGHQHPSEVTRAKAKISDEEESPKPEEVDVSIITNYLNDMNLRMAAMEKLLKGLNVRDVPAATSQDTQPISGQPVQRAEDIKPVAEEPEPW